MNKPEFNPEVLEKSYKLFAQHAEQYAQLETELLSTANPMHSEVKAFKDKPFDKSTKEYIDIFKKNNELFDKVISVLDEMVALVEGTSESIEYSLKDDVIVLRVYLVQMMNEDGLDFEEYYQDLKMKHQMFKMQKKTNDHLISELSAKPN